MSGVMAVPAGLRIHDLLDYRDEARRPAWLMTWPIIDTICEANGSSAAINFGQRLPPGLTPTWPY
jgi:hypothetical protein